MKMELIHVFYFKDIKKVMDHESLYCVVVTWLEVVSIGKD